MDRAVETVLREFEERSRKEWELKRRMEAAGDQPNVDEFLLSVGPATGQLINLLVKEAKSQTILEVGSSYGYSTVWLAEAARETGGRVISLELHQNKQEHARASLVRAGLDGVVDFRLGDARQSLAALNEQVDFVLLDLWKNLYISCFDLFYPKLQPGALVVADNMIFPESSREHAEAYRKHIRTKAGIESVLLSVGTGLELSRYR
jgi:predicted O-methyltransferase YrrM